MFAVISPIPMAAVLLITVSGWSGFYEVYMGKFPLFAFLVLLGESVCVCVCVCVCVLELNCYRFTDASLTHLSPSSLSYYSLPYVCWTGLVLSVVAFFVLSWRKPPHWSVQIVLGVLAFVMSIAWLNIEANEVVNVLNAFGLSFNIDPGKVVRVDQYLGNKCLNHSLLLKSNISFQFD